MKKEVRTVCFDETLSLEALSFEGVSQPFPNHFHDYYVIGLVLRGTREMYCKNRSLMIGEGDVLLLEPADNHGCVSVDADGHPVNCGAFDYIALNISENVMRRLAEEITGDNIKPSFSENVVKSAEFGGLILKLHKLIFDDCREFEKEETLLLLISHILENYAQPFLQTVAPNSDDVERVCEFMDERYGEHIGLDELCRIGRMSKSTLLRSFAKYKGITPYRYLQSVRINRSKDLLEQGTQPIDAAALTGFSDQSHFSNSFHMFIGLSPAAYGKIFGKEGRKNERKMRDDN